MKELLIGKSIQDVEKHIHCIKIYFTDGTFLFISDGAKDDSTKLRVDLG